MLKTLLGLSVLLFGCATTPSIPSADVAAPVVTRPTVSFDSVAIAFDYTPVDKLPRLTKNAKLLFSRKMPAGDGGLSMNWLCSVPLKVEIIGSEIRLAQEINARLKSVKMDGTHGVPGAGKKVTRSVTSTFISMENNVAGPLKRATLEDFLASFDRTADFPEINRAMFVSSKLGFSLGDERSRDKLLLSFTRDAGRWASEVGTNVACKGIETSEITFAGSP